MYENMVNVLKIIGKQTNKQIFNAMDSWLFYKIKNNKYLKIYISRKTRKI